MELKWSQEQTLSCTLLPTGIEGSLHKIQFVHEPILGGYVPRESDTLGIGGDPIPRFVWPFIYVDNNN